MKNFNQQQLNIFPAQMKPLNPKQYLDFVWVSNDTKRFIYVGWLRRILDKNHFDSSSLLRIKEEVYYRHMAD